MNQNLMMRRLKRDIGIYGIALPLKGISLEEYIMEIIEDTTIPVFSVFCPVKDEFSIDLNVCRRQGVKKNPRGGRERCELFIIPETLLNGRSLYGIQDVEYDDSYASATTAPVYYQPNMVNVFGEIMVANAEKDILDEMINPVSHDFVWPKRLYIYDAIMSSHIVCYGLWEHDKNLQTITPYQQESFFELAILDVEAALYQLMKHYNNGFDSPGGNVPLNIDDWANAKQERKDLIKEWEDIYQVDISTYVFK